MPLILQGDARRLPLSDESVDLIVTSPPYFGLRSYTDNGEHYQAQIGSEATPQGFLDALIGCTAEMMRVLKPSGSIWLNLGDSYYSGKGAPRGVDPKNAGRTARRTGQSALDASGLGFPRKSLLLLPHRFAIRCMDELGLTVRQDQVWKKANGLPESATDRTRHEHEYLFHLVKRPRYYSAVDEIREPASGYSRTNSATRRVPADHRGRAMADTCNPRGKLPGSVWEIPSQPLNVPDHISHARCCFGRKRNGCQEGIDHYAAFPFALVRPIILGWSPREVCTACGEGRKPVAAKGVTGKAREDGNHRYVPGFGATQIKRSAWTERVTYNITGYFCACPDATAPSTPGVVLDPFGGTGSAALVAAMCGRTGISVDASGDYSRILARWRCSDPKERARAAGLDPEVVARIQPVHERQGSLWDELGGESA